MECAQLAAAFVSMPLTDSYDPDSRMTNRWSKARGNTVYGYDSNGNLLSVTYATSPTITMQYDALNRLASMVDAVGTTVYAYSIGGRLFTEDGPFPSDTVTNTYSSGLRTGLVLQQPTGTWTNGFLFDAGGRLTNVTSQAGTFAYTLGGSSAASPLLKKLLLPNTSYISDTYDSVARLQSTALDNSGGTPLDSYTYTYNTANQRTGVTRTDASTVTYSYDNIGQLTVADSSVNSEDRGYYYDASWNLNRRTNNGATSSFSVDPKDQLTTTPTGSCTYDDNGNLLTSGGGHYGYSYDDENELIGWEYYQTTGQVSAGDLSTSFVYDGKRRLRIRKEWSYYCPPTNEMMFSAAAAVGDQPDVNQTNSCYWQLVSETHYIYDGIRVIQERDGNNGPTVSYTRGTDLSGSLEGAGGIGGLLGRSVGYSGGNWTSHAFYRADGNGNVTYLVDSSQGLAASYRYDPFGNLISSSGTLASANVYRFSSKEVYVNSGMYYYLYRFYDPNLQRWTGRDPYGHGGGVNLFAFVKNHPISTVDKWGLIPFCSNCKKVGEISEVKAEHWIVPAGKTPDDIKKFEKGMHEVHKLEVAHTVTEAVDLNVFAAIPKPDLEPSKLIDKILANQNVDLYVKLHYKVCTDVGKRFFFFGGNQLKWIDDETPEEQCKDGLGVGQAHYDTPVQAADFLDACVKSMLQKLTSGSPQ